MRKGLLVMLAIASLMVLGLPACGEKEQAKQENEASQQLEEQAELAPEVEEPKGAARSGTPEEEADLGETGEDSHGRTFDEGKETGETEEVYEEPLEDEEQLEDEEEYREEDFLREEAEDE